MFASTSAASREIGTVRAPVLESASFSPRASRSTSCQRNVRISLLRQPDRGDGMDRDALAGLRLGERTPQTAELLLGEEPLASALTVPNHQSARVARLRQQPPVLRRVPDAREGAGNR